MLPPTVQRGLQTGQTRRAESNTEILDPLASQIKSTKYIKSLIAKLNLPVSEKLKRSVAERAATMEDVSPAELAENLLVEYIREQINITMTGFNIITITVSSSSPVMARKMTQTIAEIFLEESLAQELAGIQGNISFTEEQLDVYRDKLYEAQNKLKQFRQDMIASSVEEDTTTMNYNLKSIFSAVEALDIELNDSDQKKTGLMISLLPYKIDFATLNLPGEIRKSKTELMNTIPKLADLLGRYSWRDAKIIALNQEAKDLSATLDQNIKEYVARVYPDLPSHAQDDLAQYLILETNIEFMQNKSAAMEKSIGKIKYRLTRDPDVEVTLDRLQSEVSRYRELYNLFVEHSQYAAIDQSAKKIEAESKYMIVKPAVLPLSPISPNRKKMLAIGIALGLMLGAGFIFLKVMIDDSFKKVEDVENFLRLKVLATVPRIATPYTTSKQDRGLIYAGSAISLLLLAAIIFMKFRNG